MYIGLEYSSNDLPSTSSTTETKPQPPPAVSQSEQQPIHTNQQTNEHVENIQPTTQPTTVAPPPPPPPPQQQQQNIQPPQQEVQNEAPAGVDTTGLICVKDHPDYAPFFKMQKVGVPSFVVQGKMNALGLNGELLDTPDELIPAP